MSSVRDAKAYQLQNKPYQTIASDALSPANPYKLDDAEQKNLRLTLNTLDKIETDFKVLMSRKGAQRTTVFLGPESDFVALHLGPVPEGKEGEKYFREYLLNGFVAAYSKLREHKYPQQAIKFFCEKLGGECIDSRTREAFKFAAGKLPLPFRESLDDSISQLGPRERIEYFENFAAVLRTRWGHPFLPDDKKSDYSAAGTFNESDECFDLIKKYLASKKLQPGSSFATTLKSLNQKEKPIFMRFLLSHKNILEHLRIHHYHKAPRKKNHGALIPAELEATHKLFNASLCEIDWNQFIASDLDFEMVEDLLLRAYPETCFHVLMKSDCCKKLNNANRLKLMQLYIAKLEFCEKHEREVYQSLVAMRDANGNTILSLAGKLGFDDAFAVLAKKHPQSLTIGDQKNPSPTQQALSTYRPKQLQTILEHKVDLSPYNAAFSFCAIAQAGDEKLFVSLIDAKANVNSSCAVKILMFENKELNIDALTAAATQNQVNMMKRAIIDWKPDNSRPSPLIAAVVSDDVKPEIVAWLIEQKKIPVNAKLQGKSALLHAIEKGDAKKTEAVLAHPDVDLTPVADALNNLATLEDPEEMLPALQNTSVRARTAKQLLSTNAKGAIEIIKNLYQDIGHDLFILGYDIRYYIQHIDREEQHDTVTAIFESLYLAILQKNDTKSLFSFVYYLFYSDPKILGEIFNGKDTIPQILIKCNCSFALKNIAEEHEIDFNLTGKDSPPCLLLAARLNQWDTVALLTHIWPISRFTRSAKYQTLLLAETALQKALAAEVKDINRIKYIFDFILKCDALPHKDQLIQLRKLNDHDITRTLITRRLDDTVASLRSSNCCLFLFSKHSRRDMVAAAEGLQKELADEKADFGRVAKQHPAVEYDTVGEIYRDCLRLK